MKKVNQKAEFLMMGSDSFSYMKRIEQAANDVYLMVKSGLITDAEALDVFNRKMGC